MSDEDFMREALKEALEAEKDDEVPVGAVVVKDGTVVADAICAIRLPIRRLMPKSWRFVRRASGSDAGIFPTANFT